MGYDIIKAGYTDTNGNKTEVGTTEGVTEVNPNGKIIRNVVLRGETKDFDTALERTE